MTVIPVLLSGGSGTRLWPLSRATCPKQFLKLLPGETATIFQLTALRLSGRKGYADPIVVCSDAHRFIVAEQLEATGCTAQQIILEPVTRNTAPAVTVAALAVARQSPDSIMVVMPTDHIIQDTQRFLSQVDTAVRIAQDGKFVLFGVIPTGPSTGFGYIRRGATADHEVGDAYDVVSFVEKPDAETAARLLESGDHLWNSGIFVLQAGTFLAEAETRQPEMVSACRTAYEDAREDLGFLRLECGSFALARAISLDHAVMEHTQNAVVIQFEAGWRDVGSWTAVAGLTEDDASRNTVFGTALLENSSNCLVYSEDRLIAGLGLENLVIADTRDALLVAHRDEAQNVTALVETIRNRGGTEHEHTLRQYRPWGYFDKLCTDDRFQVKRLHIRPGGVLSLQRHHHRSEHWVVVNGTAQITHDDNVFQLKDGQSTYLPVGGWHRVENSGTTPLEIIEVQIGSYLGEDDIDRKEDIYGRGTESTD